MNDDSLSDSAVELDDDDFGQNSAADLDTVSDRDDYSNEELLQNYTDNDWLELSQWILQVSMNDPSENECGEFFQKCSWLFDTFFSTNSWDCAKRYSIIFESSVTIDKDYALFIDKICSVAEKWKAISPSQSSVITSLQTSVLMALKHGYEAQRSMMVLLLKQDNHFQGTENNTTFEEFKNEVTEKGNHQWVYLYMLEIAKKHRYRRLVYDSIKKAVLYEPKFIEHDGQQIFTFFYQQKTAVNNLVESPLEVADFVYSQAYPVCSNTKLFAALTATRSVKQQVCENLRSLKTEFLPDMNRHRYWHSFKNGIYCIESDCFYWFDHDYATSRNLLSVKSHFNNVQSKSTVNFHDCNFHEELYNQQIQDAANQNLFDGNYNLGIETPMTDMVLNRQMFTDFEKSVIFAMLGRTLYPTNYLDSWQLWLWCVGKAGTGKSTLLKFLQSLFCPEDVAVIGNKPSEHFGLEGLNRLIVLGTDLGWDFSFDQVTWQSMVTGERTALYQKYQTATTVLLDQPGAFASNEFPKKWLENDKQGQFSRRVVGVPFNYSIDETEEKSDLFTTFLLHEKPAFLKKCNIEYKRLLELFGNQFKANLPRKFTECTKPGGMSNNWLNMFIAERCSVPPPGQQTDSFMCSKDEFHHHYMAFCSQNANCPRPPPTFNNMDLVNNNIEIVVDQNVVMYVGVKLLSSGSSISRFF